jgi:hypothetical protein
VARNIQREDPFKVSQSYRAIYVEEGLGSVQTVQSGRASRKLTVNHFSTSWFKVFRSIEEWGHEDMKF